MKYILSILFLIVTNVEEQISLDCLARNSKGQCEKCSADYFLIDNNCFSITVSPRQLEAEASSSSEISPEDRCLIPLNNGNCGECIDQFVLYNEKCFFSTCDKFNGCLFCDYQYCIRCKEGFSMTSSNCQQIGSGNSSGNETTTDNKNQKSNHSMTIDQLAFILVSILLIVIILNVIIIVILAMKCISNKKKKTIKEQLPSNKDRSSATTQIKEVDMTLKNRNISNEAHPNNVSFNASNDNLIPTSLPISYQSLNSGLQTIQKNCSTKKCIACHSDKIYVILNCGCELCFAHYLEYIKEPSKLKVCNTHKVKLVNSYIIQNLSSNDSKRSTILHITKSSLLCPICKKTPGVISMNCGCDAKLCDKCFKDIIKMVNYYQCPSCQMLVSK